VTAYQEERKRSHDFQNQLSVLRGMVEHSTAAPEFLEYLDSLLNVKLPATRYINTNRPVADVLLSQKMAVAKNKEIQLRLQLDDLSNFYLPDDEMVVVLANLLDNAIEACEKIAVPEQRNILVKIQCKKEASYLYIENATAAPVQIKNNHVVKQQKPSIEHGFGLQNVSTILERRGALYDLCYQEAEAVFCFSAQLLPIE
jgi:sensor histidine kinase regulating citrate/malate metabolism